MHQARQGPQDGDRIGKELKDETAHRCVKRFVAGDLVYIGVHEAHILKARRGNATLGPHDRARVALYAHHLSRRTHQPGRQHCYVSDARADVQDTLTWTDACFPEESLGERSETRTLSNEALVLSVRAAKSVI